jgi:hypothetical protein
MLNIRETCWILYRYCRDHHDATGVVVKVSWRTQTENPAQDVMEYEADSDSFRVHKFSLHRANSFYQTVCGVMDFQKPVDEHASAHDDDHHDDHRKTTRRKGYTVLRDGTPYVMDFKEARKRSDDIQVYVDIPTLLKRLRYLTQVGMPKPEKGYDNYAIKPCHY